MRQYQKEWGKQTGVYWAKAHTEDGGKKAICHEKENTRADEDAEAAYKHLDTPACRGKCVSQLDVLYGLAIGGKVVVHKMEQTVPQHPQVNQYLRYWKTRSGAGEMGLQCRH